MKRLTSLALILAVGLPMLLSAEPMSSAVVVSSGLADDPEPKDEDPETDVICGMPQHAQYVVMATGAVVQKRNAGSSPETVLD